MYKPVLLFMILGGLITSCQQTPKPVPPGSGDSAFRTLSESFTEGYLAWRPELAVGLGFHQYDGKNSDLSRGSIDKELARLQQYDRQLAGLDTGSLSTGMKYDFQILQSAIRNELFQFEDADVYTRNPMVYVNTLDINLYIKRNFAPLEERLRSVISIEQEAPLLFEEARNNLGDTLARPFVETAIDIANGYADFLQHDLIKALQGIKNDSLMKVFYRANNRVILSLKEYAVYLRKEKLPHATGHFALGKEKYARMLHGGECIPLSPGQILEIGLAQLAREKQVFDSAAALIDPTKKPVDVFREIQHEHPAANNLIPDIRKNVDDIRAFIADHNLVTIPTPVNLLVRETPQYGRSTSTASMDSPGPFEKAGLKAYYYVTPVDPAWTPRQKDDWLSMFNRYTADLTTIHEVYPGHYTQFLHLNASHASEIEKIYGSYAFIEGWAHYAEKMMIDEGFGRNGNAVMAAKYRLAQSNESLLRLCRLCVSIQMHCNGMTLDQATHFFMDNMYLGEKPAYQEALRGTFDPGYLYYTLGKLQILKLRNDYKKQEGDNFSLQKFHDLILDKGMPPIPVLRQRLLHDPKTWKDIL